MYFETWYKADLQRTPQVQAIMGNTFTQDNLGNLMGAVVTDGGEPVALTGAATGYVIRPDGNTVVITGTVDGDRAYIILPEAAYAVPGMITVTLRLVDGSAKTVLAAWAVNVQRSASGDIIDPGHVVPSLDELLAQIDAMEQGTAAANQAASAANAAAANADAKAALADQKAALANTKAGLADAAAANADTKAALADEKATLANTKAGLADAAAANADTKAALADEKATLANTKAGLADAAAANADTKAALADEKATLANTKAGLADAAATEAGRVNIAMSKSGEIITITTTDRDNQQATATVTDPVTRMLLLSDAVPNTVQAITFDNAGNVSTIVHANNGVTVRTDTFTFTETTITEARVLAAGGSLTLATDLTTLQTTVTYTAA